MKRNWSIFYLILISILFSACKKQAGVSTFLSLGKVSDGAIEFSYDDSTGKVVNVGDVLRVTPSKLSTVNAKIVDCKIANGSNPLPSGFSVNPLTCEIVGATLTSMASTTYALEVTNSLGKKSEARVSLRIRALLTFKGVISGLNAGQSVTITQNINGVLKETQTIEENGNYSLSNLFDGDTFTISAIHSDSSFTCSAGTASAKVYTNVINNISCYGSGSRVLSTLVSGLDSSGTVNLRMTSGSHTFELYNVGNGTHNFPALIVNDPYSVAVISTSVGHGCFVQTNSSGTLSTNMTSNIQCAPNGPYTVTVKVRGINAGTASVRKNGALFLSSVENGDFVLVGTGADQFYGTSFNVTTDIVPVNHSCTISDGNGIITGNVTVHLNCVAQTYSVSGSVAGLAVGESVKIQSVTKSGMIEFTKSDSSQFSFSPYEYNTPYELTLVEVPAGKVCNFDSLNYKSNSILSNVTGANISCSTRSANRCDVGNLKLDTFDGPINDLACDSTHLYVAGNFYGVGAQALGLYSAMNTSNGNISDAKTPSPFSGFGNVSVVVFDNEGGFYVGNASRAGVEYYDSNFILKKKIITTGSTQKIMIDEDNLYIVSSSIYIRKYNRFTGVADTVFNGKNLGSLPDYLHIIGDSLLFTKESSVYSKLIKYNKHSGLPEGEININSSGQRLNKSYVYNNELFIVLGSPNFNNHRVLKYSADGSNERNFFGLLTSRLIS